jgi:hypothetical protein
VSNVLAEPMMAKGGRPKRDEGDRGTRHVRVNEDIADMVSWILRVENVSSARLLDPLLRAAILARYKKHEKAINMLKSAEEEARKSRKE